jgi:sulfur relay (sulfurtransferase) DsrF/TusC family protein
MQTDRISPERLAAIARALEIPVAFIDDGSFAGTNDSHAMLDFLDLSTGLRLLRAFSRITDRAVRARTLSLVEQIASTTGRVEISG